MLDESGGPVVEAGIVLSPERLSGFDGIRVIPDVHGAFDAFDRALRDVERDRRFVVQLGDLIDRGPYSPLCVERMLEVEAEGRGLMILGNHEVDFERHVRRGGGAVVREATRMEFEAYGGDLLERFVARIRKGPLWIRWDRHVFVHAALAPGLLDAGDVSIGDPLVEAAVNGPGGSTAERRAAVRDRRWVDMVAEGTTVVVGHAVTPSCDVEHAIGRRGGRAVFADTGFWLDPDGSVPVVDIPFAAA